MITSSDLCLGDTRRIHLLPARLDDFDALAELFAALHGYNAAFDAKFALANNWRVLLYEHFLHTYTAPDALWLLAWLAKEPVGLLIVEDHCDSPLFEQRNWVELVALYVDPSCRKTGLAYLLMDYAYAWTATRDTDRMQLYVTTQNEHARAFYRRCGWRPVQEIWRRDVTPLTQQQSPRVDPSALDQAQGCRSDVLGSGHHQLAMELRPSNEQ
jgi:GNAT superfamily N-acetyltransferase